jgi:hypothetical protein
MLMGESRETAPPLCGLEGRRGNILGRHPLSKFLLRMLELVANDNPFDPDILQAGAIPREK